MEVNRKASLYSDVDIYSRFPAALQRGFCSRITIK